MGKSLLRLIYVGVAAVSVLALHGCARPTASPERFVGVWIGDYGEQGPPGGLPGAKLTLRGDGKGAYRHTWDPHEETIMWVLRGDEFVLTPSSGGLSTAWKYHFDESGGLTFIDEDGTELKLRREEPEGEESVDSSAEMEQTGEETASP